MKRIVYTNHLVDRDSDASKAAAAMAVCFLVITLAYLLSGCALEHMQTSIDGARLGHFGTNIVIQPALLP